MLDNTRLRAELTHIHGMLSTVAASPAGRRLLDDHRRALGGTSAALLWQSLFADCLRVAHAAAAADGTIGDDEIDALYEFLFSAARHYAGALPQRFGEFAAVDHDTARGFLVRYAGDAGPFGHRAAQPWPGLALCRGAAEIGETSALERYERLMSWLIPAACQIGGVTPADARWRGRIDDLDDLRRTLASSAQVEASAVDLRVQAFLSRPSVFAPVAQSSSVYESDPFDVESIHAEARAGFEQLVDRATTPGPHANRGQMLLVLGDSGSGKTHLLRGFRRHVHEYGHGFVAYAQLITGSDDYDRYLLQHVVDSLARPYTGPSGERTGLHELASGLPRLLSPALQADVERLSDESWGSRDSLATYVERMVDGLLGHPELTGCDTNLLRVLLYGLYPQPAITARVYKYLRCEDMTEQDRARIGGVAARTDKDAPAKMIRDLARLAFATQRAALVLMVDQAETSANELQAKACFCRALDALNAIANDVPSVVAVISCVSDVYVDVRDQIPKSMLDRLETDPPVARVQVNRSYAEIEAIVSRRLSWMYADAGAVHRPESPVYPIPEVELRGLTNRRTREVLEWCHLYQAQCALAKRIIGTDIEASPLPPPVTPRPPRESDLDQIASAWNDANHGSGIEVPDEDEQILAIVAAAARACAGELGLELTAPQRRSSVLKIVLAHGDERTNLAIAVTNRSPRGGGFISQIEDLRKASRSATAVAVRTVEFPRGPASDRVIGQLVKSGGRRAHVDGSTLRTLVAYQQFAPDFPPERIDAWRRRDRPISTLRPVAELFDLPRLLAPPAPAAAAMPAAAPVPPAPEPPAPAVAPVTAAAAVAETPAPRRPLRIGMSTGFQPEPRSIDLEALLRPTAVLGSPGSGVTTLSLKLIEQVLLADVPVVLLDHSGALSGYARADWWSTAADPERARRLADRLDVRLFTPGTHGGRPLALPVIPDLEGVPAHEHEALVKHAAAALAGMIPSRSTTDETGRRALLEPALHVLTSRRATGGLQALRELLTSGDNELLARMPRYDERRAKKLAQELEELPLSWADLFDPTAELLTAETLLARAPGGKLPLSIISTKFLGDLARSRACVAHLAACLARDAAKHPRDKLHALVVIDAADQFLPATGKPASKEPLQDLLRRARQGGFGMLLASHDPGDFDYRSRDQFHTWFIGRLADKAALAKLKPVLEGRAAVAGKLAMLEPGRFLMLQDGTCADLEREAALLREVAQPGDALIALAAATRVA